MPELNGSPDFAYCIYTSFPLTIRSNNPIGGIEPIRIQSSALICPADSFIGKCPHKATGEKKMTIRGRNLLKGLPESIEISDQDIYDAIHENAMEIVEQVKLVLESTPPELVGDILSNGILLTGGGAMLGGLPELISDNVGAPCFVAENPIECVARGVDAAFKMSGELLDGFEQIQLYNFK